MSRCGTGDGGRKMWRCNHCGLVSAWTETWVWFGSMLDAEENEDALLTFCCLEHMHAAGLRGPCLDGEKAERPKRTRRARKPKPVGLGFDGEGI